MKLSCCSPSRWKDGITAGIIATGFMSAVMLAGQRLFFERKLPPRKIVEATVEAATDRKPGPVTRRLLTVPAHFGYGAAGGALFAVMRPETPRSSAIALGALFGLAVWLGSYKGWVPAMRIMPQPEDDDPGRVGTMVAAHLVYGSTLGAVLAGRDRQML